MAEWFAMGGYAGFIWVAYGASVLGLVGLVIWSVLGYRKVRALVSRDDDPS